MRKEKNKKTTQALLVIFISFIMVTSVIGFIWSGSQNIRYGKFSFEQIGNGYATTIQGKEILFNYLPQEVEKIQIDPEIINRLANTPQIDSTSYVNDTNKEAIALAQYDLTQIMEPTLNIYLRQGFTTNSSYNLPVIDCDVSTRIPILYFKTSNQTKVSSEESCIIIESEDAVDVLRVKDRLLYSLLGVIK